MKQFDSLRAIAVLMVVVSHWFPNLSINKIGLGAIGVDIFFVLSGFLITRILIVEKINFLNNPNNFSRLQAIKNFTIRRSLRIFPIYFTLLFLLIVFNKILPNSVSQDFAWYFLYLQNILFCINQSWPGGKLSHLWTLAVEEQFYLIWPWVILFISQKWLLIAIIISFILGIASTYFLPFYISGMFAGLLATSCMHAFAAGGLLAYFNLFKNDYLIKKKYYIIVSSLLVLVYFSLSTIGFLNFVFDLRTSLSITMVGLLTIIIINPNSFLSSFSLGNPLLVFIVRISYGVYLFHNFIPLIFNSFLHFMTKKNVSFLYLAYVYELKNQTILFYLICFILLLIISFISFHYFELPIRNLKNKII